MRKFNDIFASTDTTTESLNIVVERHPNSEVTDYHFNRRLNVTDGSSNFELKNGNLTVRTYGDPVEPTEESLELASKLLDVNGLVVSGILSDLRVSTYGIRVHKTLAVPDDEFDRDVITVLAEYFGVTLDNVTVDIQDRRNVRNDYSWSMGGDEDDNPEEDEWPNESAWNNTRNFEEGDEDGKSARERQELAEAARGIRERSGLVDENDLSDAVRQPDTLVDEELSGER